MRLKGLGLFLLLTLTLSIAQPTTSNKHTDIYYSQAQIIIPPDRFLPGMVFDSSNQRIILFGGGGAGTNLWDDTWSYDYNSNNWIHLNPHTSPSARHSLVMVYDSSNDVIILFGGWTGSSPDDDTWIFDCATNNWTEVFPEASPPPRMSHNMVYDSVNDRVILWSGYGIGEAILDETWQYDYSTNTWEELNPTNHPAPGYGHCMIYDSAIEKTILFGGNTIEGTKDYTWEYDYANNEWNELSPSIHPIARKWGVMAYDSINQKSVMFGGNADPHGPEWANDTWIYDSNINQWSEAQSMQSPSGRSGTGLAYDSVNQKVILFGGMSADNFPLSDTWSYDYISNNWTDMSTMPTHSITTSTTTSNSETLVPVEWILIGLGLPGILLIFILIRKTRHNE